MALSIPIISEFSDVGVKRAIAEFKQLETVGEKAQFAIKKAAIPAAAALAGLAAAAGPAISAASDLEENLSKVNVIFGEGAKEIENFAKTAAASLGQSQNAVLQAAGTFGTFGKAAGLGGVELANFSNDFTALASDLASFNNTSPEEAINAIGSALRGEAEPLRKYGVLLDDATLKNAAMSLGIFDGNGALTAQQKILAAQKVIFEQTGDAQGDFARTSDGLANSQRILKAQLADLQVAIGEGLLPVVQAILPPLKAFAEWAVTNPRAFQIIAGTIAAVATAILAVNFAMNLNPFGRILLGISALITVLTVAYTKFEGFRNVVNFVINSAINGFESMANAYIKLVNIIIDGINLIKPGTDIGHMREINLPNVGGAGPVSGGGAAREGGIGNITPTLPAMPTIPTIPLPSTGGGAGNGGGRVGINPPKQISPPGGGGGGGGHQEIFVNVTGGLATSAEIGQAVVNAIRAYNRSAGPAQIQVA